MYKLFIFSAILIVSTTAYSQPFPRDQKIVSGEYFINSDPGEGKGMAINTGSIPLWEVTVDLSNISLPIGSKIFVRFKSSNGTWSGPRSIVRKPYFENRGGIIQYGEYYINTDQGQGNDIQVNFQNGTANVNGLDLKKEDRVYFRIKDNFNRWSPARKATFTFKEIDKAEYYIKHASGDLTNIQNINASLDIPSSYVYISEVKDILPSSYDTVFIRFQTLDKFYSPWAKNRLDFSDGINEIEPNTYHFYCYPNPFTNQTKISFELPGESNVRIRIVGLTGNVFQRLADEVMYGGVHEIQFNRSELPAGIYFCQLETNHSCTFIKLIVKN